MADNDFTTDEISYYINLAIEQYSDVSMFFYLDKCMYSQLKTICVAMKNGYCVFRADLSEIEQNPLVWGSEVSVYFVARDDRMVPCQFKSRLARIYNNPPNHMLLALPMPRSMDHNQRRFSRRVNIDEEAAARLKVWQGGLTGGDSRSLPGWGWLNLDERGCEVTEISANGMRLDINQENALCGRLDVNDTLLLKGDFGTPSRPMELFVLASIARKMPKLNSEDMISLGCYFRSWRKVDADARQTWFRADPQEGVAAIAQWISRNFRSLQN